MTNHGYRGEGGGSGANHMTGNVMMVLFRLNEDVSTTAPGVIYFH